MKRERRAFRAGVAAGWDGQLGRLYFLDEFGSHLGLTRLYGRAQPGQRVVEATPGYSGPHFTTVAALSLAGVCAPLVFEGAMNGLIFATYVQDQLGPCLRPGAVLVVDNLAAHRNGAARADLEARGVQLVYLPVLATPLIRAIFRRELAHDTLRGHPKIHDPPEHERSC